MPRTCGAARSARRPVKAEVAGSNPVRSAARLPPRPRAVGAWLPGRVAQLVERAPEKREVTGSTPVPTTCMAQERRFRSGVASLTLTRTSHASSVKSPRRNDTLVPSHCRVLAKSDGLRAHFVATPSWNRCSPTTSERQLKSRFEIARVLSPPQELQPPPRCHWIGWRGRRSRWSGSPGSCPNMTRPQSNCPPSRRLGRFWSVHTHPARPLNAESPASDSPAQNGFSDCRGPRCSGGLVGIGPHMSRAVKVHGAPPRRGCPALGCRPVRRRSLRPREHLADRGGRDEYETESRTPAFRFATPARLTVPHIRLRARHRFRSRSLPSRPIPRRAPTGTHRATACIGHEHRSTMPGPPPGSPACDSTMASPLAATPSQQGSPSWHASAKAWT